MSTNPSAITPSERMPSTGGEGSSAAGNSARLVGWCVLAAAFLLCYSGTLRGLIADWWSDPDYSFGLIAPFAVGYIVFSRRKSLLDQGLSPMPFVGLSVIIGSQLVFLVGQLGAEFFLQRSSMILLAAGAVLYLAGWNWLKHLALPLLLLELCIPLPAVLWYQVSMPLQLISSSGAAAVLKACGLAVYRSGNILQLPHNRLNVVEACSGLRSLMTMISLALLLISSSRLTHWARAMFVASAALVAVVANTLRISGTGLLVEYVGRRAIVGQWHAIEGWFVFVVAFLMLSAELAVLQRLPGAGCREGQP